MSESGALDLPVLRDFDDLPVPLPSLGPQRRPAPVMYAGWVNWCQQRQLSGLAYAPLSGELWAATAGGILRWGADRQEYTRYTSEHGLPGNAVRGLAVDGTGRAWAAPIRGGLYFAADEGWLRHESAVGPRQQVGCLAVDREGRLWVGTAEGLLLLDLAGDLQRRIDLPMTTPPRALACTHQGGIWLCNAQGTFAWDGGSIHQVGKQATTLALASHGTDLWLGTAEGLAHVDLTTRKVQRHPLWPLGAVTALHADAQGVLVACDRQVGRATVGGWQLQAQLPGADPLLGLTVDGQGELWVASASELLRVDGGELRPLTTLVPPDVVEPMGQDGVPLPLSNLVQALAVEERESRPLIWVGTPQGLYRHDPTAFHPNQAWQLRPVEGIYDVTALAVGAAAGELWCAGWAVGVSRVAATGSVGAMAGIEAPVLTLAAGLAGVWWAVALDGLYRSQGGGWNRLLPASRLPAGVSLRTVAQTASNRLWLGTSAGLMRYDPEQDDLRPHAAPQVAQAITALAYDPAGQALWAGTPQGLLRLHLTAESCLLDRILTVLDSGLAADTICALAVSAAQPAGTDLWIGTPWGLSCLRAA